MYQHILVAIDLSEGSQTVLKAAAHLASTYDSKLCVVHACQSHVTGYGESTNKHHIANEMQVKQHCYPRLKQLLETANMQDTDYHLPFGNPADVIHQAAKDNHCDLIVVGSHAHQGLKALLGSTANAVLHGANCDVYTVRIYD